jgi:HprK-related kinase B
MTSVSQLAETLCAEHKPAHRLMLRFGDCGLHVDTNSEVLLGHLSEYFKQCVADVAHADTRIVALNTTPPDFGLTFTDWPREGGKSGRKEAFADIPGGRVIHKVRTGMQFLLGDDVRLAVGDCVRNDNQVINFAITQYINWLMERGYVICHSAAIVHRGKGLMFSGLSGGGKSTLALHLMSRGASYTSNDRVMLKGDYMAGVPKLPRINPGTALHNPDLAGVVPAEREAELRKLSRDELWQLEEKYDVYIDRCFGPDRFAPTSQVHALFVLNWDRNSKAPTVISPANLLERPDLLGAVSKSPGPFWLPKDGTAPARKPDVDPREYHPHVSKLRAYEITGRADFALAVELVEELIENL